MTDRPAYDVAVVGGGPAGMTTALYTTRLGHPTAVLEKEGGRHAKVSYVHNLYGVSEDVSGEELSLHAVDQFQEYGGDYYLAPVEAIHRRDGGRDERGTGDGGESGDGESDGPRFVVEADGATVEARRVVLATGFTDIKPSVPDLERFAGRGLHYCLHCDAYSLGDERVFVLGHDDYAAEVAMLLLNFTDDVDLLLDGRDPEWDAETDRQLRAHPLDRIDAAVEGAFPRDEDAENPWIGGLRFADGNEREYRGGFAMYGKEFNVGLAEALGCDRTDEGAIDVDDGHETSVDGVYAVGDVTHGQNQTAIAIADGARAGIALHKDLRTYPLEDLDEISDAPLPGIRDDLRARMRLVRERSRHAGLREPSPDR